jgi:hypothetical protein
MVVIRQAGERAVVGDAVRGGGVSGEFGVCRQPQGVVRGEVGMRVLRVVIVGEARQPTVVRHAGPADNIDIDGVTFRDPLRGDEQVYPRRSGEEELELSGGVGCKRIR